MGMLKGLLLVNEDAHGYHDIKGLGAIMVESLAAGADIEMVMTDDFAVLESDELTRYDLCVSYTFEGKLTAKQEEGLLSFVKSGRGFVGIHTATVSFLENEGYIDMLGGKFKDHASYGEFAVVIKEKDHPITAGVADFSTTDELYATYHGEDIHTLATARGQEKDEPMVWTKPYGKGRVCYIALGHDAAGVRNENFLKLLLNAVQWAAGEQA